MPSTAATRSIPLVRATGINSDGKSNASRRIRGADQLSSGAAPRPASPRRPSTMSTRTAPAQTRRPDRDPRPDRRLHPVEARRHTRRARSPRSRRTSGHGRCRWRRRPDQDIRWRWTPSDLSGQRVRGPQRLHQSSSTPRSMSRTPLSEWGGAITRAAARSAASASAGPTVTRFSGVCRPRATWTPGSPSHVPALSRPHGRPVVQGHRRLPRPRALSSPRTPRGTSHAGAPPQAVCRGSPKSKPRRHVRGSSPARGRQGGSRRRRGTREPACGCPARAPLVHHGVEGDGGPAQARSRRCQTSSASPSVSNSPSRTTPICSCDSDFPTGGSVACRARRLRHQGLLGHGEEIQRL